ncbi:MAG: methyltransferase domain-containing protein [Erysipelotrichaceae bacterium]|nr:methyltransferase domain-containing protein [Erysipelotrichaceae bacterium]
MKRKKKTDYLRFIDYEFTQDEQLFKSNTDTAVFGMFLDMMKNKSVLDIGTNTGALLLYAHYHGARYLYGVDIHEEALKIAEENLKKYSDTFKFYHSRVQDLNIDPVDVIICNPPFFEMNNVTDDRYFREAMFEESLPLNDLFVSVRKLMKDNGEVYLLYQADRFPEVYDMCKKYKLKIMKMQYIHDIHSKHALRIMLKMKIGPMSKLKVYEPVMIDRGRPVKAIYTEW